MTKEERKLIIGYVEHKHDMACDLIEHILDELKDSVEACYTDSYCTMICRQLKKAVIEERETDQILHIFDNEEPDPEENGEQKGE